MTDLEIKPIPKTSMVDAAFDVLRSRILRGILAPGDRLPAEQE
ncbi:MAG: GntR family transcriptional regulator, partial [Deltaproteobacteria bacterium]|nr:GntR family transcriptional regulator [Deltaproteobacteria bacterium]